MVREGRDKRGDGKRGEMVREGRVRERRGKRG